MGFKLMQLKILTTDFWKTIFSSKEHSPKVSKKETETERLQEQLEVLTIQHSEIEHLQSSDQSPKIQIKGQDKNLTVRSELNLEQNAVFTVSTYKGKSREIIIKDAENGIERRVIIGKTIDEIETGVLTIYHFKLYLTLLDLWEKAGRPVNESVHFTTLQIIKRLGIADAGTNYERVKRQLINLSQIPITFIDSFYLSDEETFRSLRPFQILSYLDIYERKYDTRQEGQKTRGYGEFRFHDNILSSLINNYSHPLRLDVITEFKKHKDMAILLYTYLDRQLAFKSKYEIGLKKLFDHLDLSQKQIRYPAARKQKIEPVLGELNGKELSTGILSSAQISKTKSGNDYKLVCHKKPFARKLKEHEATSQLELALSSKTEPGEPAPTRSVSELFPSLVENGLTQKQAAKLIEEKSPETINAQLVYLPFRLREYETQGKEINAPAILYDSISDNWQAPKGYLGAEKEKERGAKRLEQERIARIEQEERDKAEQERAEIEIYKKTLDPEERAKLRDRALEQIRGMEGINEQFISEPLIAGKENEMLKLEMDKDNNVSSE